MEKRSYLAGVGDSELYKREDSELRRKDIISFWHDGGTIRKKFIELVDKVRIKVDESLIKHFIELLYIVIH